MRDLLIVFVVVAPALVIGVHLHVRATEMIHAIALPPLHIDLGPLHHGVAAVVHISHVRSSAVRLLRVVIGIKVVIHRTVKPQHTRPRHKLLSRSAGPATVAECPAEIHYRLSEPAVLHIARIGHTGGGVAVRNGQVKPVQILPEGCRHGNRGIRSRLVVRALGDLDRNLGRTGRVVHAFHGHNAGALIDGLDLCDSRVV